MVPQSITIARSLKHAIVSTLEYYNLLHYPLTAGEILGNLPKKCSEDALFAALEVLVLSSDIYYYEGYYSLDPEIRILVIRREAANKMAHASMPEALKIGAFVYKFPFVRFAGISGSLSVGHINEEGDFDFFIVTEKNRLWICRTLLHLFKKTTVFAGRQRKFRMNYFIDSSRLEIEEKNRHTAIELASVIPAAGNRIYNRLISENGWVDNYLPNGYVSFVDDIPVPKDDNPFFKKVLELVFNVLFPNQLNYWLMRLTAGKWQKKWAERNYPMSDYKIAFKTTLHMSKNHPANSQKRVLEALAKFDTEGC
jgi:hypothetical protein